MVDSRLVDDAIHRRVVPEPDLVNDSVYPAQALLFAYLITALLNSDVAKMRSRANFLSIWWLVIAVVEFIAYTVQNWGFGYASEKMVLPDLNSC